MDLVVRETPLDYPGLPSPCAYVLDQVLDPAFFPKRSVPDAWPLTVV
ncbi:MAG: hypothetical protein EDM05_59980 [Leptolyngbya sp. IPPAS B-1204]|nr:hypothetical protein [Elainella sp. C42_A2020_010]